MYDMMFFWMPSGYLSALKDRCCPSRKCFPFKDVYKSEAMIVFVWMSEALICMIYRGSYMSAHVYSC